MKSIGSNKTTGPEALLIATIRYWVSTIELMPHIENHVNQTGAARFNSKKDQVLAQILQDTDFPLDKLVKKYWEFCSQRAPLKFIVEYATRASKKPDRIGWAKQFVSQYIAEMCGSMIKQSEAYISYHQL